MMFFMALLLLFCHCASVSALAVRPASTAVVLEPGHVLNYHGGPVMTDKIVVDVIWYGDWAAKNRSRSLVEGFITGLGATAWWNIQTMYTGMDSKHKKRHVTGQLELGNVVFDEYSQGRNLSNKTLIQKIVTAQFADRSLTASSKRIYMILGARDVKETSMCSVACGWHDHFHYKSAELKYAFVGDSSACPHACYATPADQPSPNANHGVDSMVSVIAHELTETATDPTFKGWWENNGGNENADQCAWNFGRTFTTRNKAQANIKVGGRNFLVQQNFINGPLPKGGRCAMKP